tara:strand:+ start:3829 stop:4404 length:576 start_codon:yes stop_codon:yes gene_type:complete
MIDLNLHKFCLIDTLKYHKINIAVAIGFMLGTITGILIVLNSGEELPVGILVAGIAMLSMMSSVIYIMVGALAIKIYHHFTKVRTRTYTHTPSEFERARSRKTKLAAVRAVLFVISGIVVMVAVGSFIMWVFDPEVWWDAEDIGASIASWFMSGFGVVIVGGFSFIIGATLIEKYGDCKTKYNEWLENKDV